MSEQSPINPELDPPFGTQMSAPSGKRLPSFREVNPRAMAYRGQSWAQLFHRRISSAAAAFLAGASVDIHPVQDYKNMRLFLTEDQHAGFAVHPSGELVSVFKHPVFGGDYTDAGVISAAHSLLVGGATHLSAYEPVLPKMYTRGGYRQTASIPWNEEYKPDNWPTETLGRPNVAVMAGAHRLDESASRIVPKVTDDYDAAIEDAKSLGKLNQELPKPKAV